MRLNRAIDKLNEDTYSPQDFHQTLESIIRTITEDDYSKLKNKLLELESELELIDFTVNTENRRSQYLKSVSDFNSWISKHM